MNATVSINFQTGDYTSLAKLRLICRGFLDVDGGVVLGSDRANRHTTGITGTGRATIISLRVSRRRCAQNVQPLAFDWYVLKCTSELQVRPTWPDLGHRKRCASESAVDVLPFGVVAGDTQFGLRLAVPRLEVGVPDRPIDAYVVFRAYAEVVRQIARGVAQPVPG